MNELIMTAFGLFVLLSMSLAMILMIGLVCMTIYTMFEIGG